MISPAQHRGWRFAVLILVIAVLVSIVAWLGPPDPQRLEAAMTGTGVVGPVIAILGVAAGIVVMIPRTVLSIASGLIFGWLPGFAYIVLGCLIGASVGFLIGRWLGRDFVADKLAAWSLIPRSTRSRPIHHKVLYWMEHGLVFVDRWLSRHGVLGVWTARVLPIAHFGLLSYGCGAAAVQYRHFAAGTAIASIPGALGYTAVGGAVLAAGGIPLALGIAAVMNAASLTAMFFLRRRWGEKDLPGPMGGTARRGILVAEAGESEKD